MKQHTHTHTHAHPHTHTPTYTHIHIHKHKQTAKLSQHFMDTRTKPSPPPPPACHFPSELQHFIPSFQGVHSFLCAAKTFTIPYTGGWRASNTDSLQLRGRGKARQRQVRQIGLEEPGRMGWTWEVCEREKETERETGRWSRVVGMAYK